MESRKLLTTEGNWHFKWRILSTSDTYVRDLQEATSWKGRHQQWAHRAKSLEQQNHVDAAIPSLAIAKMNTLGTVIMDEARHISRHLVQAVTGHTHHHIITTFCLTELWNRFITTDCQYEIQSEVNISSFIAQYPVLTIAQSTTLYFPDRPVPTQPFWEVSSHMLQLMCEGCSYTYPPLSIARYPFIQLSELEQCRVKKRAQGFNTAAQDLNMGSFSQESEALPLSHCALHWSVWNCWMSQFTMTQPANILCSTVGNYSIWTIRKIQCIKLFPYGWNESRGNQWEREAFELLQDNDNSYNGKIACGCLSSGLQVVCDIWLTWSCSVLLLGIVCMHGALCVSYPHTKIHKFKLESCFKITMHSTHIWLIRNSCFYWRAMYYFYFCSLTLTTETTLVPSLLLKQLFPGDQFTNTI